MKRVYSLIAIIMATVLMFSSVNFVFAAEERELTNDEKAAFIVRDEWTGWVRDFTASLSELDKNATAKIYDDMDFYDMQYRFTEKYKKVPEYLDEEGKPTQKLKDMIKEKRKEINMRKSASSSSGSGSSTEMIDWTGVDTRSWMSKLPNDRYLNDINIPGVDNAAMVYTESEAIEGDTTDLKKATSILGYCRQTDSVYVKLNAGYRAFDYGLTIRYTDSTYTAARYGLSYTPTDGKVIVCSNAVYDSGGGTSWNMCYTYNGLVKELNEMVRFLIDNPTETIVVLLRYSSIVNFETLGILATFNEMIEKQTFPYVDGGKNSVNLKDYVYIGSTFPKLKDIRKKIVIVPELRSLSGIGINFYSSSLTYDHYRTLINTGTMVDNVSMYTEYKEDNHTADERVKHITTALDTVTAKTVNTNGKKGKNGALTYASGCKLESEYKSGVQVLKTAIKPSEIATEVNKAIKNYDFKQGQLVGMLMMDFATDDLAQIIIKTNP